MAKVPWVQSPMEPKSHEAKSHGAKVPYDQSPKRPKYSLGAKFQSGQCPVGPKSNGANLPLGLVSLGQRANAPWGKITMWPKFYWAKVPIQMVPKPHGPKVPCS